MVHWNIQGFSATKLSNLLKEACIDNEKKDIVGLVETWSDGKNPLSVEGYNVFERVRNKSSNGRHYGGIAILIRDDIFDSIHRLLSASENIVWLQMSMWDKRYVIGCVYIPPENSSYMNEYTWDILIEEYVNYVELFSDHFFVLLGDFNTYTGTSTEVEDIQVDLGNPCLSGMESMVEWYGRNGCPKGRTSKDETRRKNRWGHKLINFCSEGRLIILNGRVGKDHEMGDFTCFGSGKPSVIDYIMVDRRLWENCLDFYVMDVVGSDHQPIEVVMKAGQAKKWMYEIEGERYSWRNKGKREYKGRKVMKQQIRVDCMEENRLKNMLESEQMQKRAEECIYVLGEGKLEEAVQEISEEVYQKCSGISNNKERVRNTNEFFDEDCRRLKVNLIQLLRKVKGALNDQEMNKHLSEYRTERKIYKRLLKMRKKQVEEIRAIKISEEYLSKDPKQFWSEVRREFKANDKLIPPAELWKTYLEKDTSKREQYEDGIGSLVEELREQNGFPLRQEDYSLLEPIKVEEVCASLKGMKGSSAPGVDGIPAKIWKMGKTALVPVLAAVFSFVTENRKWPDQWNVSVGIPIFKKGNRQDRSNYRIISLGNVMSKIFCKVIDSRLGKWLE
ncbi:uncharacterized protein LOC136043285, partial [Artemia franciscana]|uniref:uncharacterized protein LOC136043285 n=1 Tax=Artemia franciscana TaxID=6661 RepID=UPI0032DB8BC9